MAKTINEWAVTIDKSGVHAGLWIATATRDGMTLTEYAGTRKRATMLIEIAIETEMENPWWKNEK